MLNSIFGKSKLITLSALALILLLPLFAYLQFVWLGELNEQESARIRSKIENSAFNLNFQLSKKFFPIQRLFNHDDDLNNIDNYQDVIIERLAEWRKFENVNFINKVHIVDENSKLSYTLNENADHFFIDSTFLQREDVIDYLSLFQKEFAPDMPNSVQRKFSLIITLFGSREKSDKYIFFELNSDYIISNIIKPEFEELTLMYQNELNGLALISNKDSSVIYSNFAFDKYSKWRDSRIPIGMLPPQKPDFNKMEKFDGGQLMERPEKFDTNNKYSKEKIHRNPEFYGKMPSYLKPYSLVLDLKSEGLNFEKYRNLIISFILLFILGIICIFFLMLALKTQKIASQQLFFFAGLPHELRTPLSVIRTASQNLSDGIVSDHKKTITYGSLILAEIDKLWAMIENALMYAGIQSQQRVFTFVYCDLSDIFKKALDLSKDVIAKNRILVDVNIPENTPKIKVDQKAFMIVLENIVSNAAKFSRENGKIEIYTAIKKKRLEIHIKDSGMGIFKKELSKIFKPFYRSKDSEKLKIQGSGIGLSIVKNILDAHKAKISVESEPNVGSHFIITVYL